MVTGFFMVHPLLPVPQAITSANNAEWPIKRAPRIFSL